MDSLPELGRYPTVDESQAELDELAARYPVTVRRIGTSRLGEPIRVVTIGEGEGERDALVLGGPHPNEPVGGLTVRELGRLLCAEPWLRAGLRWHLVPCIDPDGARLNESWYGVPGDRDAYGRGFYRPAMDEQPEWTFPHLAETGYFDRMLPETVALARLIDEVRPVLLASLHNAEYGGAFHYTTTTDPALAELLASVPGWFGVPLQHAVYEVPGSFRLTPGVLRMPTVAELTEGAPPGDGVFGASSGEYAGRYGAVSVITEVPMWADPRASDSLPTGRLMEEVVAGLLAELVGAEEALAGVLDSVRGAVRLDTPHRRALDDVLVGMRRIGEGWRRMLGTAEGARAATVADECAFVALPHTLRLRAAGTLLRVLAAEQASGNVRPAIRAAQARAESLFTEWRAAADGQPGTLIPLRAQAGIQLGSILAAAAHLVRT
ncbi:M14 family zinc carboxypeptidase [Crossiella cryophila]